MSRPDKLNLVAELRCYDHAFISAEGVRQFSEAFGVPLTPTVYRANPTAPKGLTLDSGASSAAGLDAADMAETIAWLVCGFKPYTTGRGFRLRSACDALHAYYSEKEKAKDG